MTGSTLRAGVFNALDNALENGDTTLAQMTAAEVALDLVAYDADLEEQNPDDLVPHVEAWRAEHPQQGA